MCLPKIVLLQFLIGKCERGKFSEILSTIFFHRAFAKSEDPESRDNSSNTVYISHLKEIEITNSRIESIGTDSFYDLTNLVDLDLTKNRINSIKPYAFRMRESSEKMLRIDLTDNLLNESSFHEDSLLGAKRFFLRLVCQAKN